MTLKVGVRADHILLSSCVSNPSGHIEKSHILFVDLGAYRAHSVKGWWEIV